MCNLVIDLILGASPLLDQGVQGMIFDMPSMFYFVMGTCCTL